MKNKMRNNKIRNSIFYIIFMLTNFQFLKLDPACPLYQSQITLPHTIFKPKQFSKFFHNKYFSSLFCSAVFSNLDTIVKSIYSAMYLTDIY